MNTYTINIEDIYKFSMIPAVKVRDILRVRIMTSSEKEKIKRGSSDIIAIDPFGNTSTISRDDLLNHYTYLRDKKISIAAWKSGKEYLVKCLDESPAFAMMIPENCQIQLNNKIYTPVNKRGSGQYVVCMADADGNPDASTLAVISSTMFHKIFYIPPSRVILRYKGKKRKSISNKIGEAFNIGGRASSSAGVRHVAPRPRGRLGTIDKKIAQARRKIQPELVEEAPRKSINRPSATKEIPTQGFKYEVVAQVVDDVYGQRTGFIIQSSNGQQKSIPTEVLIKLCQNKKVSNVVLVVPETGRPFLRGNGISLDNLPIA